jgi:uncharacterized protein YodC (DUF2158 family)
MARQFKVGDIVQLKSGGPKMTVDSVDDNIVGGRAGVWATWFAGSKHQRSHFHQESIELAPNDEKKK